MAESWSAVRFVARRLTPPNKVALAGKGRTARMSLLKSEANCRMCTTTTDDRQPLEEKKRKGRNSLFLCVHLLLERASGGLTYVCKSLSTAGAAQFFWSAGASLRLQRLSHLSCRAIRNGRPRSSSHSLSSSPERSLFADLS